MNPNEKARRQKISGTEPDEMLVRNTIHSNYALDFAEGQFGPELIVKRLTGEATHPLTGQRLALVEEDHYPLQDPTMFRLRLAAVTGTVDVDDQADEPDA